MENDYHTTGDYSFLTDERMEKNFADLNIKLLSGRHIQNDEYIQYSLLEQFGTELTNFYAALYKLNLVRGTADQAGYYYLDFFDTGKGKLSDPSRYRELTALQTIVGLMLLDMYYARYFDEPKRISWEDIQYELTHGDRKGIYQTLFFNDQRENFSDREWDETEKKFRNTVQSFHDLGWVEKISGQNEPLLFELKPAIHRMAKLYENELADFETFSSAVKASNQE